MVRKAAGIAREGRLACEKWRNYFHKNILHYHFMIEFILGSQWEEKEEDMLVTNKKIPLTSNKLGTMSNTLLGEQQQNTPQLQVIPMTNCDEKVAEIRELILKDIVFSNNSATVVQVAANQAFNGGFAAILVDTEYTHSHSFDQDIIFRSFKDSTRGFWDIGAEKINKTDGMHGGFISRMTRQKFRNVYGKKIEEQIVGDSKPYASKEEVALATSTNLSEDSFSWADEESICILDFYKRKFTKDTLYKLSNGKVLNQKEMDELIEQSRDMVAEPMDIGLPTEDGALPAEGNNLAGGDEIIETASPDTQVINQQMKGGLEDVSNTTQKDIEVEEASTDVIEDYITLFDDGVPVRIEEQREIKRSKIIHYKIAGDYVLEESVCPCEQIPVIYVDQNSYYDKDGKQVTRSFFDDVKDTQRFINYLRTQSAYILKISRYDQFIGSKKNVQGLDTQRNWKDPQAIQGLLTYDESPSGAKPEQLRPPELSVSLFQQYQLAIEDLYTSTGLYPTRMGAQGQEISGDAIDARTRQGSYPTYVAFNSINRAWAVAGEIVNEMIPHVYDAKRVIALMTPDEGIKNFTINNETDDYGAHVENDIRKGTYQVRLKPGPSYEGQKEQALQSLQQVMAADPSTFRLLADLYAENLPLPNNLQIKNRLKTIVPPDVIEAGKNGGQPMKEQAPTPEQQAVAMQQQQLQMQMQVKQKELEIKEKELMMKAQQQEMENQIELMRIENEKLQVAGELQEQELRYLAETDRTQSDNAIAHADNLMKILTHKADLVHKSDKKSD